MRDFLDKVRARMEASGEAETVEAVGIGEPEAEEAGNRSGPGHPDAQGGDLKKLLKPAARREVVRDLRQSYRVSLRRACGHPEAATTTRPNRPTTIGFVRP